jgi:hypothetical protein
MAYTINVPDLNDIAISLQRAGAALEVKAQERAIEKEANLLAQIRREKRVQQYKEMSIEELERHHDIRVIAKQDEIPVRGNALASGDDEEDRKYEDEILERLDNGDVWAWADVEVHVTLPDGRTGACRLGGCSYKDEADFKQDGGYYEDLVNEAVGEAYDTPLPDTNQVFLEDLLSFVTYLHRSKDMDDERKLNLLVGTLMHDLSGTLDGDEFFSPRVSGYSKEFPLI